MGVEGFFPLVARAFLGNFFLCFKQFQPSKVNLPGKQESPRCATSGRNSLFATEIDPSRVATRLRVRPTAPRRRNDARIENLVEATARKAGGC